MRIKSITIGGFRNIERTEIRLDGIVALVSINNFGKSNLLEGIDFGIDFLTASAKQRDSMMKQISSIPLTPSLDGSDFMFEVELEDPEMGAYANIKYGYSFRWFRDDGSGNRITDEWLKVRSMNAAKTLSLLKRENGEYRKDTGSKYWRKIRLDKAQLALEILSAVDDVAYVSAILAIQNIQYSLYGDLDVADQFLPNPVELGGSDSVLRIDDADIPRAMFKLRETYPEKYQELEDAIYDLFPEFEKIELGRINLDPTQMMTGRFSVEMFERGKADTADSAQPSKETIPFKIREQQFRLFITSTNINQSMSVGRMSDGTRRVIWLLTNAYISGCFGSSLLGIEELETGIHPRLMRGLLKALRCALGDTPIIITSHSPLLIQYLKPDSIYVGIPTEEGAAKFKRVSEHRTTALTTTARKNGLSAGEYLFELMCGDADSMGTLQYFLEG